MLTVRASLYTVFPSPDSDEQVIIWLLQGLDDERAGAGRPVKHAGLGPGKHCLNINRDMNLKTSIQTSYLVNYVCFFGDITFWQMMQICHFIYLSSSENSTSLYQP